MYKELKEAIIKWLFEHENEWQRVNTCLREFKEYIYNAEGNSLIGGKAVTEFITEANKLIYG